MRDPAANSDHRGATRNPTNRFQKWATFDVPEWADDLDPAVEPPVRTELIEDHSETIIAWNDSPDIPFRASVNPYRGCEHGCAYCYARPTHEYLGYSAGLDFETKIVVKPRAPELLRATLESKKWEPQVVAMSGVTDLYQPVERKLGLSRRCLEVFAEFRNPVGIVTKNALVVRDIDVLSELARFNATAVFISLTTLDGDLRRKMEPRTTPPAGRLAAVRKLADAGIPVGVLIAPVIPGLNDHEIPKLLHAAADAGARFAGYTALRLPWQVTGIFAAWLKTHFPDRMEKILGRVRDMRDGSLNETAFGDRMRGKGPYAEQIDQMFNLARRRAGITAPGPTLAAEHFRIPGRPRQPELF
jgi:DNA repair photolyase